LLKPHVKRDREKAREVYCPQNYSYRPIKLLTPYHLYVILLYLMPFLDMGPTFRFEFGLSIEGKQGVGGMKREN